MAALPLELTLVVAATRDMGIGLNGTLPWTGLKKEMAYFARVTKRLPAAVEPPALNAVIMGRKTWDSIPPKFRPLKGRLNVVVSRSGPVEADDGPVRAGSLEQAVAYLRARPPGSLGRVFVIGGAQIYQAALQLTRQHVETAAVANRILLTRVLSDCECDTFFPLALECGGSGPVEPRWERGAKSDLDGWVGEHVPAEQQEENGIKYEFQMWQRVDGLNTSSSP